MKLRIGIVSLGLLMTAVTAGGDWQQGMEAYRRADFEGAQRHFDQLREASPCYAGAHYMAGLSQLGLGNPEAAVASLRRATALDPSSPLYSLALGQAMTEAGRLDDGYAVLLEVEVASLDASDRSSWTLLVARTAVALGRAGESLGHLRQRLIEDPQDPRLYLALAAAHSAIGDEKAALEASRSALRLDRSQPQAAQAAVRAALAVARRGGGEAGRKAWEEAAELAQVLATLEPSFEHDLLCAEAWLEAGGYEAALRWLDRAADRKPRNALTNLYRGRCLRGMGRPEEGLEALQRALIVGARGPVREQVYIQLCEVYAILGDRDRAISACLEAGDEERAAELERLNTDPEE